MAEPYLGEIRMFAGNYAPPGWAFCNGQLLSIADYSSLYSLLGTTYGGDGRTSFAVPDFRGRIPVHTGTGPGLSPVSQGSPYGVEQVQLILTQIPNHNHPLQASTLEGTSAVPTGQVLAKPAGNGAQGFITEPDMTKVQDLSISTVSKAGQDQSHTNLMPARCVSFIIALRGIYPPRT